VAALGLDNMPLVKVLKAEAVAWRTPEDILVLFLTSPARYRRQAGRGKDAPSVRRAAAEIVCFVAAKSRQGSAAPERIRCGRFSSVK